jgi:hypothetical protein
MFFSPPGVPVRVKRAISQEEAMNNEMQTVPCNRITLGVYFY